VPGRRGGRCQGVLGLRLSLASSGCCAMLPEQRWDDVGDAAEIPSGDATRSLRPLGGALEPSVNNQNPILTCTRNAHIISTHRSTESSVYVKCVREA